MRRLSGAGNKKKCPIKRKNEVYDLSENKENSQTQIKIILDMISHCMTEKKLKKSEKNEKLLLTEKKSSDIM